MGKESFSVEFETITPVFTGDAWKECSELKPSSIIGSLRFWFEVYCHFAGINVKYEGENLDYKKFPKKLKEKIIEHQNNNQNIDLEEISNEILAQMGISLPSRIFGCTGWKSRVEIENIKQIKRYKQYNYLEGKIDFKELKYKKDDKEIIPAWYFPVAFYGTFKITFKTTKKIKDNILIPLLYFIEKYGFIGAKNNLGFGRVKIINGRKDNKKLEINLKSFKEKRNIDESIFKNNKSISNLSYNKIDIIDIIDSKDLNTPNENLKEVIESQDLKEVIKSLLKRKAQLRKKENNKYICHYKFGSTAKDTYKNKKYKIDIEGPNATKIIPLISKENGKYVGKFLSIWGIQNFGVKHAL